MRSLSDRRYACSDDDVNNREAATLIWLGIALVVVLLRLPDVRGLLWESVKLFMKPAILGPVVALAAWTVGLVALAHTVGLWEADVRNDTVIWFVTVGIAFFFSLRKVEEGRFFRKTARRAVAATVFVEAFVNLAQFGLIVELLFLPSVTFLVLLDTVAARQDETLVVHRLVNRLLSFVGVCFLVYSAICLVEDFDAGYTVRALVLPVWLALGVMPFIYVVGLWSGYQQAFLRIDSHTDDPSNRSRAKRALLRAVNVRASELGGFAGHWIWDLSSAESDAHARAVMQRWRATWRAERHAERTSDARAFMRTWLSEDNPTLAEIHADTLRRSWERLDAEQRAMLKAEGMRLAPNTPMADEVQALPD
jgi:hypothetical protein